jgi:RsiW-degrading membrane proteinase PrsW (M82 family)
MSTSTPQQQHRSTQPIGPMIFAVAGAVTAIALTGYGTFKDSHHSWPEWLVGIVVIVAATVLVYAVFVRRALRHDGARPAARTALVLAVLAVATTVLYNFGFDAVLASAAICTALAANHRAGRWTAITGVAMALSAAAVILAILFAITG